MDVIKESTVNIYLLDTVARAILGDNISGVSAGPRAVIHLLNDSPSNQVIANTILNQYGSLSVVADKTAMIEGDDDPVITVASTDAELGYFVLLDDEEYDSGDVTVITGVATLNLVDPVAGIYQIFVYRKTGDFASGSIQIIVSEV